MNDETTRDYGYLALVTDAHGDLVHSEVLGSDTDLKVAEEDILATVRMIPHLRANEHYAVEFRQIGDPVDGVEPEGHGSPQRRLWYVTMRVVTGRLIDLDYIVSAPTAEAAAQKAMTGQHIDVIERKVWSPHSTKVIKQIGTPKSI